MIGVSKVFVTEVPKGFLYGELASGKRAPERPLLHFKDVCMCAGTIDVNRREGLGRDRKRWRQQRHPLEG